MRVKRREFLLFLGTSLTTASLSSCEDKNLLQTPKSSLKSPKTSLSFQPVKGPMPLATETLETQVGKLQPVSTASASKQQIEAYKTYEVVDDIVLPEGFTYDLIAAWGEPVGDSRFGYNNDYLSFVQTGENEGYLTINFEYISSETWLQTYEKIIGKSLPIKTIETAFKTEKKNRINAFELPKNNPVRQAILEVSQEGLIDMGMGVISIRRNAEGKWFRTNSNADRRITGISGWSDGRYLKSTGPAIAVFRKKGKGYTDKLGDRIIGTFGNCAGGTTPWGTVFSAEENIQTHVPEDVYPDGTPVDPGKNPFSKNLDGLGNVFGLAGNKYGWMVEVDPANAKDYGTKHTWLGRYRHEAVGIRAEAGKPLAFYSGCDRRGGHLYKFVSQGRVKDPKDKANSRLLEQGMLYAAKFNEDGSGRWIPLKADTPVNPDLPSVHAGGIICLPSRPSGGAMIAAKDEDTIAFKKQYKTLGDLYEGDNPEEVQGAILIDAHLAASAAGATCTARPEDTDVGPLGSLFIAFTSGSPDDRTGGPDLRVFKSPTGETVYEYGWIMRLSETGDQPDAESFRWQMFATGGEVADGGWGFANPDNLEFDGKGNLWMVTDMSTGKHNQAVPAGRVDEKGEPLSQPNVLGVYGNNSVWFLPTSGENAGNAYLFAMGPMECEMTGPFFSPDQQTLFMSVQHPGEAHGIRQKMAVQERQFAMRTTEGEEFIQTRRVPIGSNWPQKSSDSPPLPGVVAIRRLNSKQIV
ncbi:PhoX family protein [Capilliphycus salinus ALCB114379]|uniref:PhoX family protein n=1 Tax=Capilliphycus salinus TaxID=2768948 RepID=UPI0039A6545E